MQLLILCVIPASDEFYVHFQTRDGLAQCFSCDTAVRRIFASCEFLVLLLTSPSNYQKKSTSISQ